MAQHKWHKEIKAWADGAEIEHRWKDSGWLCNSNHNGFCFYDDDEHEYRIKQQPKEPQYLYVYHDEKLMGYEIVNEKLPAQDRYSYIGKIKLEQDDE